VSICLRSSIKGILAPSNVRVSEVTNSSAVILWDIVNEYRAKWRVLNDSIIMIKNITGGINSATVSDLEPNTQYAVSMSSIGMGVENTSADIIFVTNSTSSINFADTMNQTNSTEPFDQMNSTEPVDQVNSTEPVDQVDSTGPVDQVNSTGSIEQVNSTEPIDQANSIEPVNRVNSTGSVNQVNSTEPVDQVNSTEPIQCNGELNISHRTQSYT